VRTRLVGGRSGVERRIEQPIDGWTARVRARISKPRLRWREDAVPTLLLMYGGPSLVPSEMMLHTADAIGVRRLARYSRRVSSF
jgi:hypothetical protein